MTDHKGPTGGAVTPPEPSPPVAPTFAETRTTMSDPKERPILMMGEMVRATLEDRKLQTRRVVKLRLQQNAKRGSCGVRWKEDDDTWEEYGAGGVWLPLPCPYGVPGDRLWVREAWGLVEISIDYGAGPEIHDETVYRATQPSAEVERWRPSIFMERDLSRIDLEVTAVRVERVQEISGEDAIAEGIEWNPSNPPHHLGAAFRFGCLWDTINAKRGPEGDLAAYSWGRNPWVWVVEFKRIRP